MDEYIKKAEVFEYLSTLRNWVLKNPLSTLDTMFVVMEMFDFVDHKVESADVAPVRHARWECGKPCPVCGGGRFDGLDADIWADWEPPYCPNCGCLMAGGEP